MRIYIRQRHPSPFSRFSGMYYASMYCPKNTNERYLMKDGTWFHQLERRGEWHYFASLSDVVNLLNNMDVQYQITCDIPSFAS